MRPPRITIYTRFHYEGDIPESALFCFENYYLKSLNNQTYKGFWVVILSNHNEKNNKIIQEIVDKSGLQHVSIIPKEDRILYKNEIELNIDCDDSVSDKHIEIAVYHYYNSPHDIVLLVYKYLKHDIQTGKYYKPFSPTVENRGFPTPFYAIIQREAKCFEWACRKHNQLNEVFENIITIEDHLCTMNIRNNNESNKIYEGETEI